MIFDSVHPDFSECCSSMQYGVLYVSMTLLTIRYVWAYWLIHVCKHVRPSGHFSQAVYTQVLCWPIWNFILCFYFKYSFLWTYTDTSIFPIVLLSYLKMCSPLVSCLCRYVSILVDDLIIIASKRKPCIWLVLVEEPSASSIHAAFSPHCSSVYIFKREV